MIPPMPSSIRSGRTAIRFDSPQQEIFLSLWRTYDRLRMLEDDLFSRFGLTAQQYNVLRQLRSEFPQSLPTLTLANRLVSRAPDITRMLDKLERRSLVIRERLPGNRRVVQVRLGEPGLELLEQLSDPVKQCHEQQLGHLTEEQLKLLGELLRQARLPHEEDDSHWH